MKRLFIAAIALTASTVTFASANSLSVTPPDSTITATLTEDKTPVKIDELPVAVKNALKTDFAGWNPVVAYWVKSEKSSFYEIELQKGDEKKIVNLTAEGARVM
jgi:hypothetical protein